MGRYAGVSGGDLIDFLGFGYSDAPADFGYTMEEQADSVAALVDYLGLRGVHVVGHSMGGSIAISLAAHHPAWSHAGPAPKNGVTVAVVPEAGHLMNVDNPDGFAHAIANAVVKTKAGAQLRA
jgi:pimeloyl-ACP methyl ester carboxylesterase